MGAHQDIEAIVNNRGLPEATKQRLINERRVNAAHASLLAAGLPGVAERGEWRIDVHRIDVVQVDAVQRGQARPGLNIWCEVFHNGVLVPVDTGDARDPLAHFHFPNPPVLRPDVGGSVLREEQRFREDPSANVLDVIIDHAKTLL